MFLHGYQIWISDDKGKVIPEFQVHNEGNTTTCFIPSESGKRFTVRWEDHNGRDGHHFSLRTFLDGRPAGKTHNPPGAIGRRRGISTQSADTYQPFQFADLQTTDDEDAPWAGGAGDALGTIEARVIHVHGDARKVSYRPAEFAPVGTVHERSKKVGGHCVSLGGVQRYSRVHGRVCALPLDRRATPVATFVFQYKPAAILQAQEIMPPPSASANENEPGPSSSQTSAHPHPHPRPPKKPSLPPLPRTHARKGKDRPAVKPEPTPAPAPEPGPASASARARVKEEPVSRAGLGWNGHTIDIELTDSEDERPQKRTPRRPVKRERREYDPGDVIDLTSD